MELDIHPIVFLCVCYLLLVSRCSRAATAFLCDHIPSPTASPVLVGIPDLLPPPPPIEKREKKIEQGQIKRKPCLGLARPPSSPSLAPPPPPEGGILNILYFAFALSLNA